MVLDCCDTVAWEDGSESILGDSSGARFLKKSRMDFFGVGVGGGFSRRAERVQYSDSDSVSIRVHSAAQCVSIA